MKQTNDITDFILDLEQKYNLLYWKINDVYIWQLIRVDLFLTLQEKKYKEKYDPSCQKSFLERIRIIFHRVYNSIILNPLFISKKYDVIFFDSGRKYLIDNRYEDIYTYFLKQEYDKKGKRCLTITSSLISDNIDTKHIDSINLLSKFFQMFFFHRIIKQDLTNIASIKNDIFSEFEINIDIESLIRNKYKKFKSQLKLFELLINKTQCKEIFLVNYLNYPALISIAKKKHVKVSEIQHGLLVKESLVYHFPSAEANTLEYFPSQFYIWENFKFNTGRLPISSNNIIINSYNHLSYMKKKYQDAKKNDKSVLISSQPFFSKKIADFILNNAKEMDEYIFYYKIHPLEFESFEKTEIYQQLLKYKNISFIKNETSIYELMAKSKTIIGIYSTSLFEAFYFNCNIFIIESEGIDITNSLLKQNNVHLIKQNESLKLLLE